MVALGLAIGLVAAACSNDSPKRVPEAVPVTTLATGATTTAQVAATDEYRATIRRTSYGIAHITAADLASAGFGQGYALAEDHACSLLDRVVKARSERAKYNGRGENDVNLNSDLALKSLDVYAKAKDDYAALPADLAGMVKGYAAGVSLYVTQTGAANVPGYCAGKAWVKPVDEIDLMAVYKELLLEASSEPLLNYVATAQPPSATKPASFTDVAPADEPTVASNGWAFGSERTESGGGMLLANPHFPWEGSLRLWESQITVPGVMDVYGVSLIGVPGVLIGFNSAVSWTHTVSAGARFTGYTLDLAPGQPTSYLYDGQARAMTSKAITIDVKQTDGSIAQESRTLWSSQYGPILNFPGVGWTNKRALSYRDANLDNRSFLQQFNAMNRARSMDELQKAHADNQGIPWVNTMATSADGRAWYVDSTPTPNLSPAAIAIWLDKRQSDPFTKAADAQGFVVLDGSDSRFEWQVEAGSRSPGLVPFAKLPQLERKDFIFNSNDSYWLTNPASPLTGYSPLHGLAETARTPRTRRNLTTLTDTSATGPMGTDGKWSLKEIQTAALSNKVYTAELLVDEVVAACKAKPNVVLDSVPVDLTKACDVLAKWDRTYNIDAVGAGVWREFVAQWSPADIVNGTFMTKPFDKTDPIHTPSGLADTELARTNLAKAVRNFERAGFALDAKFGDMQYTMKNGVRIPVGGGDTIEGVEDATGWEANVSTTEPAITPKGTVVDGSKRLTKDGYATNRGTSFIMTMEFTKAGPHAEAILTYGESGDPKSPFFSDQMQLFSARQFRPIVFTDAAVTADTKKTTPLAAKR